MSLGDDVQFNKTVYLDHAASTFLPNSVLKMVFEDWNSNQYCNPHSQNNMAKHTRSKIEEARALVKSFFDAHDYDVVFTHNATAALKIVGENFPFSSSSIFAHTRELHNSALGIREYAYEKKANVIISDGSDLPDGDENQQNLFVCSGECNFSGIKMKLENIVNIKKKGWKILLDAAKLASTSPIQLSKCQPDFVAVSFYKIFGFPSGLGCLLIHKSSSNILSKKYFSGGTVESSTSSDRFHVFRKNVSERFEDGSVPFLNIISLLIVLKTPEFLQISMAQISNHTFGLASDLYHQIKDLKHYNGNPIAVFYGNHDLNDGNSQGSILTFNFLNENGGVVGYSQVEQLCGMENIQLRVGCFCNPGACETYLGLTSQDVQSNHKRGHVCWDDQDIIDGKTTGAVRVSFGYCSTKESADAFFEFAKKYFVIGRKIETETKITRSNLTHIIVYPIKSCPGVSLTHSKLGRSGLVFDREWTIVNEEGIALKLNQEPRLSLIKPLFDGDQLILEAQGMESLKISLRELPKDSQGLSVCGSITKGLIYTDESISQWLSTVLQQKCFLVRKDPNESRLSKCKSDIKFSNEAPYLLVTRSSLDHLHKMIKTSEMSSDWLIQRFRPNFVIENTDAAPYEEELYHYVTILGSKFSIIDKCNRCTMICVDPESQQILYEPLKTLSTYKRQDGKLFFGILLSGPDRDMEISTKDKIYNF